MSTLDQLQLFEQPTPSKLTWHQEMLQVLGVQKAPNWPDHFGRAIHKLRGGDSTAIRTLSLFSGGGGLDIAFHDAGFHITEMVEIETAFAKTLAINSTPGHRFEGSKVICMDIRDYQPSRDLGIGLIIGGPPCQTFSAAGRRAAGVMGTNDPRGTLFEEYVRILKSLSPKGFLFENVYGITGAEDGKPWRDIQAAFEQAGYTVRSRILDAADYGVPQHRERLFIVGVRKGEDPFQFPFPTHGPDSIGAEAFNPAGAALAGVEQDADPSLHIGGRWGELIQDIPPGLNYSFYTREMGHPRPVFAWRSKFSDFMYKADPETPVRTVKAQGGLYTGPFSWEGRHFSAAEIKRLQTFPDDYEVLGGRGAAVHQLGNSVPPQLGRILALAILKQMFGVRLPFPMHLMEEGHALGFRKRKRSLTEHYAARAERALTRIAQRVVAPSGTIAADTPENCAEERVLTGKFLLAKEKALGHRVRMSAAHTGSSLELRGEALDPCASRKFEITVRPGLKEAWHIPLEQAVLRGEGTPLTATALWKFLEENLARTYGVDDLVQLGAYYQYPSRLRAQLTVDGGDDPLWRVLSLVIGGECVSQQLESVEIADRWLLEPERVHPMLLELRSLGYEVRGNNTNPQIPAGQYLVPYRYPTLTPRSVQLRKSL